MTILVEAHDDDYYGPWKVIERINVQPLYTTNFNVGVMMADYQSLGYKKYRDEEKQNACTEE